LAVKKKEKGKQETGIVIHSWKQSNQHKPLVKIQSAQVVKIQSAPTAASIIVYFFGIFGLTFISVKLRGSYFDHSNLLTLLTVVQNILIWLSLIRTSKDNQDKAIEVVETHNKFIAQQNQTLEVKVKERTHELHLESQKSERLMLNILPQSIATRLKAGDEGISDSYQNATILFSDLVGFTKMSSGKTAEELVFLLNDLFKRFDTRATSLGLEKIKTIGDAYMVAGGLPTNDDEHAIRVTKMALGMYEDLEAFNKEHGMELDMRIGINSGPVVAGVIGHSKFSYDLWGNTVNTASRMESTCLPGKVQVSPSTYEQIKGHFDVKENQMIECKGLGQIMTYFVK
jgi:class 3 adenylate cyclase